MKTSLEEKISIMQAALEGKQIQKQNLGIFGSSWITLSQEEQNWDWAHYDYRIKPKYEYIPYNSPSDILSLNFLDKVYEKDKSNVYLVFANSHLDICLINEDERTFKVISPEQLYRDYTWEDGTPCGKLIIKN